MNSNELRRILKDINFVNRYKSICSNHNDLKSSMSGNFRDQYIKILADLGEEFKYFKKENFFRQEVDINDITLGIQLTLKNGLVEASLDFQVNGHYIAPDGRLDFIPAQLDEEFDRSRYNLPKYKSIEELKQILTDLFEIKRDLLLEIARVS
ncbi:MAG: hypothetical protein WDZ35_13885 [Crocinitomicaceae bacterium]